MHIPIHVATLVSLPLLDLLSTKGPFPKVSSVETLVEVVEAGVVADLASHQSARQVRDAVCKGIPLTVIFFGCGLWWGLDGMAFFD